MATKKASKKVSSKKSAPKKASSKKAPAKKSTSKKAPAKKSASSKKSPGKKSSAKKSTRKYGPRASKQVKTEMHEMHQGKLRSGSGKKVTNPRQAIAIGLSEARKKGAKVPPNPNK